MMHALCYIVNHLSIHYICYPHVRAQTALLLFPVFPISLPIWDFILIFPAGLRILDLT